jgi:hypothetical protein
MWSLTHYTQYTKAFCNQKYRDESAALSAPTIIKFTNAEQLYEQIIYVRGTEKNLFVSFSKVRLSFRGFSQNRPLIN